MEKTDNKLAELITKAIEVAEKTGEFVIDQAPDLLREFYAWHIVSNAMGVVIFALLFYLGIRFFKICGKKEPAKYHKTKILGRYYETDEMPFFFICVTTLFLLVISGISFTVDFFDLVKILVAPKIYLLEHFIR